VKFGCLNCNFLGLRKTRYFSVCPLNANELLLLRAQGAVLRELALNLSGQIIMGSMHDGISGEGLRMLNNFVGQ